MKKFARITLKTFPSKGFSLTPIEFLDLIPFEVKRAYYITQFEIGAETGQHCHKIEEEVFVAVRGSVTAVIDRGNGKEEIALQGPNDAMYVPNYVWHGFKNASPDAIILALTSTKYNPTREDYLENYNEYLQIRDTMLGA